MKILLRKLTIGFKYQWRWIILTNRLSNFFQGWMIILESLFIVIVGILSIILFPIWLIWEFTGLVVWVALTRPIETLEKLDEIRIKRKKATEQFRYIAENIDL